MRYVFVLAVLAGLLAIACGGSESRREAPEPSPTSSAIDYSAVPPEPVGPVPEGVLLVQKESQSPTTFGIGADGSIRRYGQGLHYVVAPDRRNVAFIGGEWPGQQSEIVIVSITGSETFRAKAPGADPGGLLWSPDGSQLAYTLWDRTNLEMGRVYTVSADGSERRQLTSEAAYYDVVGWTKDGQVLVYSEAGLVLMGAKCRTLPFPEGLQAFGVFEMSPDGRYVAFSAGDWEEGFEVWVLDVESGDSRLVADMGGVVRRPASGLYVSAGVPLRLEPAEKDDLLLKGPPPVMWSPDGRRIAYYRSETDADGAYTSELRVVDIFSGQDIGVERNPRQFEWSPDGRYLAAVRQAGSLVLFRADGSTAVLNVRASHILWPGDSTLVVVHASGLSLVDPDSGEAREALTAAGDQVYGAELLGEPGVLSPDGRYLALATRFYYGDITDSGSLYVLDTHRRGHPHPGKEELLPAGGVAELSE